MAKVNRTDDRTTKNAVYGVKSQDGTLLGEFKADLAVKPPVWIATKVDGTSETFPGNGGNYAAIAWLEGRAKPEPKAEKPAAEKKAQPAKAKPNNSKKPAKKAA